MVETQRGEGNPTSDLNQKSASLREVLAKTSELRTALAPSHSSDEIVLLVQELCAVTRAFHRSVLRPK